ncbi:MAG TPA: hypothetical protein IGS40_05395 [Trichormus sp. M33_DOE_039]|nr:hypothetical protein [Trichormus sp. M33_DOE_039]
MAKRTQPELINVAPPFDLSLLNHTTELIIEAIKSGKCTLLKNKANYRTDRPANKDKMGSLHTRGNSESEVSHPIDVGRVCREVGIESPVVCVNSLRMFGQISDENPLHFHGCSNSHAGMEFIIFSVKMISSYNPETGAIFASECSRYFPYELHCGGVSPVVFIYEEDGIVKHIAAEVGDMLILPSGVFHEFSCLPRTFVDLSSIEVAADVSILSGGSWTREPGSTPEQVISRTILLETGNAPDNVDDLTLADIPSLKRYVETTIPRLDARSLDSTNFLLSKH